MSLVSYNIAELEKSKQYRCLWCLVISSGYINRVTSQEGRVETLNIYESRGQRDRALKYWQRRHTLTETVFFTFEIPIDFYLEEAKKHI